MQQFNELEFAEWTVDLIDPDDAPAVPTTVHWRLKCLETDTILSGWASLTPTITYGSLGTPEESYVSITVPASLHAMQTDTKARERKALTIAVEKDTASEWNSEIVYEVVRLKGRSD